MYEAIFPSSENTKPQVEANCNPHEQAKLGEHI